jgi:capsule polysaccharide modification protein KpsS
MSRNFHSNSIYYRKEAIIHKLLVFERKILRRIFGPTKENRIWRVKTNAELAMLIKHKNIINHIKAQRLSWFGHVQKMPNTRVVKEIFNWKPLNKNYKEGPSIDGRITSKRTSAK